MYLIVVTTLAAYQLGRSVHNSSSLQREQAYIKRYLLIIFSLVSKKNKVDSFTLL